MKKDDGLPASRIPQTIEDAIEMCIRLGERYLWADRLCIIQDDAEDQKNQIEAMGTIYSSAQIVLVAAYGDSMEFGIPGISRPRKLVQHSEDILGFRVTNVVREVDDDPLNMWNARGWTYQEAVLSNRRLYFTDTRAFFECERSLCHEDQFNLETIRDDTISTRLILSEDRSRIQSFMRHLGHYTPRKLTYRSDTYKALYGISRSLYNGEDAFIHGLPVADFDRALLWYAETGRNAKEPHESQGESLPTWSWASVMGLSDRVDYQRSHFYGSLALNGDGLSSCSIAAFNAHCGSNPDENWQLYMAIAIKEGCVESVTLPFSLESDNFGTVRELFNARWKDYDSFRHESIPVTIKKHGLPDGVPTDGTKQGIIATRSQTALLRVSPTDTWRVNIINSEGDRIGGLCGDAENLKAEALSGAYNSDVEFEFAALSLSGVAFSNYSGEELLRKSYTDVDGKALSRVPIVNVLMIIRNGGFARRREVGWIELVDWARLRRVWKVVVLE
ncbi:heterokaryon incompatibility protein-domain-containing protein [Aspergillus spectabilis]